MESRSLAVSVVRSGTLAGSISSASLGERRTVRPVKLRPAHVVLLLLAVGGVVAAVAMFTTGLRGTIEDSPLLSYVALGVSLAVLAVALIAFVAYDARRAARRRRAQL